MKESASQIIISIRAEGTPSFFIIHFSFFTLSPSGKVKKYPPLTRIRGGIQSIPRFHPGYSRWLSLIDAVTGMTGGAFPPHGSESGIACRRGPEPSHQMGSSLGFLRNAHVFRQSL